MASLFSHAISSLALGQFFPKSINRSKVLLLGAICAVLPDADVLAFKFGIPYEHMFGHRGISHSIFFAVLLALFLTWGIFKNQNLKTRALLVIFLFLSTISHGMLDAMTTGGKGVAFFAPFENSRYFFPWRVIKVSPITVSQFFGEWGIKVLKSELVYVFLPSGIVILITYILRRAWVKMAVKK